MAVNILTSHRLAEKILELNPGTQSLYEANTTFLTLYPVKCAQRLVGILHFSLLPIALSKSISLRMARGPSILGGDQETGEERA